MGCTTCVDRPAAADDPATDDELRPSLREHQTPETEAAVAVAALVAEPVRAGILAVPKGQREAGQSIGLSRYAVMRYIVLPQAIERVVPPLAGQFITLIKDSAIVSLISIQELTFLAIEVAASTTKVFETWILVAGMYFVLCYSFAVLFANLERRAKRSRR